MGGLRRVVTAGGDTVRGQLHKESYFGRIRDPESGEKKSVLRKELNSQNFKTESALAAIVDPAIREAVSAQLRLRMSSGKSFKEAMDEGGFRMRSGDDVFQGPPIRKVRSFVRTAEPLKIRRHAYASEAEYKNYIYADTAKGGNFKAALFRAPRGNSAIVCNRSGTGRTHISGQTMFLRKNSRGWANSSVSLRREPWCSPMKIRLTN